MLNIICIGIVRDPDEILDFRPGFGICDAALG